MLSSEYNPILLPTRTESARNLTRRIERLGFHPLNCFDFDTLRKKREHGSALVLAQADLNVQFLEDLSEVLREQPAWAQLPIVVVLDSGEITEGHESWLEILEPLGNVTLIEDSCQDHTLRMLLRTAIALRERQFEVRDLLSQLEISNRVRERFLTNISHEIRTPLCAVLGFSELLMEGGVDASDRKDYMSTIRRNGRALSNLIDDLLDLAQRDVSEFNLQEAGIPLSEIIEDVLVNLRAEAAKKGLVLLRQDFSTAKDLVRVDPRRARQILTHIIGNAIKFTSHGSVAIRTTSTGESWRIEVEDTGLGISKPQADSLFNPFTQLDPSSTRIYGGSGLGLALSRKLAREMGGDLELLWSLPGGGSCFNLTFKAVAVSEGAEEASPGLTAEESLVSV